MYKSSSFSQQKATYTAFVIIPPSELCTQVQEIRKLHDSAFDRWMPHINILFPFIPPEEFETFHSKFVDIFNEFPAFEIKFQKFGHFDQAKKSVLWADPCTENKEINKIYDIVSKELPFLKDNRPYNPHMTLGQFDKSEIPRKKEEFSKEWKEIKFVVNELHLIKRDGQSAPFYIKSSLKLKPQI